MSKDSRALHFELVWKDISKILKPIGQLPDKACFDYKEVLELQSKLREPGNTITDTAQASILKKELACLLLKNLVN